MDNLKTPTHKGQILIVDDSRSVRKALQTTLCNAGYQIRQTPGGKEALNEIYSQKPDLVLLDLVMPGLDGIAVLTIIRQSFRESELPIIILTSCNNPAEITRTLEKGASDFIIKPPDVNVLLARIKTQVQSKQSTEQLRLSQEALMRWNNPKFGWVPPDEFIAIAESTGLIYEIATWSMEKCLSVLEDLHSSGYADLKMALNISPLQFRPNYPFADTLNHLVKKFSLPPNTIELEVTEGLFLKPDISNLKTLNELRESGFLLSMDDFGTGYAALSNLISFDFDVVKIDQLFIKDALFDINKHNLVQGIIAMAQKLNLKVIAEGVEDADTHQFLIDSQCDLVQGYHFSKPIPEKEVKIYLSSLSS